MAPGMSWLYGDGERRYCDLCGETVSLAAWVDGKHGRMDCEVQRYADWTLGSQRAWKPVKSTFEYRQGGTTP